SAMSITDPLWRSVQIDEYRWVNGRPSVKMVGSDEGFCFLSSVGGGFRGARESVRITRVDDGSWTLGGESFQPILFAPALRVRGPKEGSEQPELQQTAIDKPMQKQGADGRTESPFVVAHWRFDEGTADLPASERLPILDSSGNRLHGTP